MQGLLIDLDGVVFEGDKVVEGAANAMAWLEAQGVPHLYLTNTTSRPRSALVQKLGKLGIETEEDRILTPPVAASRWLANHSNGPVSLFVTAATAAEFDGLLVADPSDPGPVAAVVVGDLGECWTYSELNRAFRLLMTEPRPQLVALGMTRYWHSPDGLRLDTAPFVVALEHASGLESTVMGKPAHPFFQMALATLGLPAAETWMVGDDIRTDIEGAQGAGMKTVLLRTGKFRPIDLQQGIEPDRILDSVADLPAWWRSRAG